MEKAGLVVRRADEADQRISRVYLTEQGLRAHQEVRNMIDLMEKTCFRHFTPEEKMIFRRLLLQMYENLQEAERSGGIAEIAAQED
ncbi:hypothetical protein D3C81_1907890 [compost metagenome]